MFLGKVGQKIYGKTKSATLLGILLAGVIALTVCGTASQSWAGGHNIEDFAATDVFLEFNATDLDLGLHLFFDAPG